MIGEAKNTFLGGMITDSHPLNTPNTVLTSCLNGTLVTFNGNEMILQNDMGNAEIGTAYLPNGYIPVGMKEYGGIIYVAAYNPETGKGQVGCYPSPEQLYTGDDILGSTVNLSFSALLDPVSVTQGNNSLNINKIKVESYTVPLFGDRVFNIGDKFIISPGTEFFSKEVIDAIIDGFLEVHLGVINSTGEIEYIDDSLRKFDHYYEVKGVRTTIQHWLYDTNIDQIDKALSTQSVVNVYNYKTSGKLVIMVKLNTFTSFNLKKTYSASNGFIKATLSGEMTGTFNGKTTTIDSPVLLLSDSKVVESIDLTQTAENSAFNYTLYPVCKYGFLDRMKKTGSINFDTLKQNLNKLTHWSYFVNENTYVKLYWKYDYFDISGTTEVLRAKFSFYKINSSNYSLLTSGTYDAHGIIGLGETKIVDIVQDSFSGDFETIIPFEGAFTSGDVYLVTLSVDTGSGYIVVDNGWQLLYASTIYNEYYGEYDFNTLDRPSVSIGTKITISNNNTSTHSSKYKVDYGTIVNNVENNTEIPFADTPSKGNYIAPYTSGDNNINYWKTTKQTTYNMNYGVDVDWDYDNTKYLGDISTITVDDITLSITPTVESTVSLLGTTSLQSKLPTTNLDTIEISTPSGGGSTRDFKITSNRSIYGMSNGIANVTRESEFLVPYYKNGMSDEESANVFNFKTNGAKLLGLYCYSGGTAANYDLIGRSGGETVTNNDDDNGVNLANNAMSNGNGTVNLINFGNGFTLDAVGTIPNSGNKAYSDNYQYLFEDVASNPIEWYGVNGTVWGNNVFPNYRAMDAMYATFADSKGRTYVTPLMSQTGCTTTQRVITSMEETQTNAYIVRADMMLRCFLSQICAVQQVSKTTSWLYSNPSNYAYHGDFAPTFKIGYEVTVKNPSNFTFKVPGTGYNLDTTISTIITNVKSVNSSANIANYLPNIQIKTTASSENTLTVDSVNSIMSDISLMGCYTNSLTYINDLGYTTLPSNIDRSKLYIGKADTTKSRYSDGTIPLMYDSLGNALVADNQYKMYDWNGRLFYINPWVRRTDQTPYGERFTIDDIFTNEYYVKYGSSNTNEVRDFFNKFYVRTHTETGIINHWGNGDNAPNLFPEIGFGYKTGYYPQFKTIP